MTSPLFSPFALRELSLSNRIVIAPMCQYSADDGVVGDWHLIHLGNLSHSGAGMLIVEATAVAPEGRISDRCPGLWNDAQEAAFGRVLAGVRRHSKMPLAIQLAHAGRKGSCAAPWLGGKQLALEDGGWTNVAPSVEPFGAAERAPSALGAAGLAGVQADFVAAAQRADRLGFDCLELHAAHGYLLHQFLSPLSNRRSDEYGGSLENRMRFPLAVFAALRAAWPAHKPLGIRVSATDWVEGGWDLASTVEFAKALKALGCDFIHVSSGGLSSAQKIVAGPGYQVPFAREIKAATGLATIAVGMITEPKQAEQIVADGSADFVALARGILYNPRWPWHAAAQLGAQIDAPPQYWRSDLAHGGKLFAPPSA